MDKRVDERLSCDKMLLWYQCSTQIIQNCLKKTKNRTKGATPWSKTRDNDLNFCLWLYYFCVHSLFHLSLLPWMCKAKPYTFCLYTFRLYTLLDFVVVVLSVPKKKKKCLHLLLWFVCCTCAAGVCLAEKGRKLLNQNTTRLTLRLRDFLSAFIYLFAFFLERHASMRQCFQMLSDLFCLGLKLFGTVVIRGRQIFGYSTIWLRQDDVVWLSPTLFLFDGALTLLTLSHLFLSLSRFTKLDGALRLAFTK